MKLATCLNLDFRTNPEFGTPIDFCYVFDRDMIREVCEDEWIDNYVLYMAANASNQTITIYNFRSPRPFSSNLLLTDDIEDSRYTPWDNLYIPGNDLADISNCFMHNYFIFGQGLCVLFWSEKSKVEMLGQLN